MAKLKFISMYIILTISVFGIVGKSEASYKDSFSQIGSIEIAKPIMKVINSEEKVFENVNPETTYESYCFQIVNFENENINEVPIEFSISITGNYNISPVSYKIIDIDSQKEITENEKIFLKANQKEIKNYKLELTWNTENSQTNLQDQNKIKIQINAIQTI